MIKWKLLIFYPKVENKNTCFTVWRRYLKLYAGCAAPLWTRWLTQVQTNCQFRQIYTSAPWPGEIVNWSSVDSYLGWKRMLCQIWKIHFLSSQSKSKLMTMHVLLWTCMKKHCCGRHSGLGLLKATSTLESYSPLSHDTSSFSLPPNKLGCLIHRLQQTDPKMTTWIENERYFIHFSSADDTITK